MHTRRGLTAGLVALVLVIVGGSMMVGSAAQAHGLPDWWWLTHPCHHIESHHDDDHDDDHDHDHCGDHDPTPTTRPPTPTTTPPTTSPPHPPTTPPATTAPTIPPATTPTTVGSTPTTTGATPTPTATTVPGPPNVAAVLIGPATELVPFIGPPPPDSVFPRVVGSTVIPAAASPFVLPAEVLGESVTREPDPSIEESQYDAPPSQPSDQSAISLGIPDHVDLSPLFVAGNMGLGGLLLLALVAAAQLFNDTLKEHHDRIVGRLSSRSSLLGRARGALASFPHFPPLLTFAMAAATLGLLADPNIAAGTRTIAQVAGMTIALALIALVYDGLAAQQVRRWSGLDRQFRLYPIAIAVAIGCLMLSRLLNVAPGILYGLMVGVVFAGTVDQRLEGRAYARSSICLVAVAFVAYGVHRMVGSAASGADAGFWTIVVDSAAAALFVGGLQAVIVQLLPTRFVNGEKIAAWSRVGWFALLAGTLGLYLQFVVRPNPHAQSWRNLWFVFALVGFAVAFWIICTLTDRRGSPSEPPVDDEAALA